MRIFESLPHLAGRATLEGVLLQTAVNSPFIYWIQSQISKQGTGVIPGYSYPTVDSARGTKRLELFNALNESTILQRQHRMNLGSSNNVNEILSPRIWRIGFRFRFD